ncbi:permease DsdX [Yersinia aldovae ATCC 35236]|nr:permease DsdX [Yersinia aldovae ATCC 35236]
MLAGKQYGGMTLNESVKYDTTAAVIASGITFLLPYII